MNEFDAQTVEGVQRAQEPITAQPVFKLKLKGDQFHESENQSSPMKDGSSIPKTIYIDFNTKKKPKISLKKTSVNLPNQPNQKLVIQNKIN